MNDWCALDHRCVRGFKYPSHSSRFAQHRIMDGDPAAVIPTSLRHLRACYFCSLVKTVSQFERDGCDNCDFLDMRNDRDVLFDATSSQFDGYDPLAGYIILNLKAARECGTLTLNVFSFFLFLSAESLQ